MPRLVTDPNGLECPDNGSATFTNARARFVNANMTEEQAIAALRDIWQAGNDEDKVLWQHQLEQDAVDAAEQARLTDEARDQRQEAARLEEEAARKEEVKRHRSKYIAIPLRDAPSITPIFPSPYAVKRLDQGAYVEMYYFTNKGLEAAKRTMAPPDDDSMEMKTNPDGTVSWTPAATSRDTTGVVADRDLQWEEFSIAVPRMLRATEQAGWAAERVKMLATFWGTILTHPYRASPDPVDPKTLLVYQDEQRMSWHRMITSPDGAWDLARINDSLLRDTKERVFQEERNRKERERDAQALQAIAAYSHGSVVSASGSRGVGARTPSSNRARQASSSSTASPRAAAQPYPASRPVFAAGARGQALSACAVCLGRHQHKVRDCNEGRTWDQAFATAACRVAGVLQLKDGRALCFDWQQARGCTGTKHDAKHLCSGCSQSSHGAQQCPRAEST
ncbi:hypothetical protein B0H21DRAFT_760592 [Amylocystis lapponica]|nr:hypothetical protein B0H21DRAFT_760592 [Amylocystis lapponica]